ncbi:hypothetical protein [Streptomyces antimicrobicus]|uniref:Lipoprotein n=1 Tax=Streptomyces antimicrobicus TaxID=2883108 RepID=A0ABS8BBZ1_9ACTN|nr:hypothetical protein [Streptomyces antimicrobicus]MCB5182149.1 hypothetical protein [Streptomyces antimicrobicus]
MTACAVAGSTAAAVAAFTIAADGSYAARLAGEGEARYPERWTLGGPEPYAVPLPLEQPEEADSEVLPLVDGRVLIHRRVAERHAFALLYPTGHRTGPRTGELPLGAVTPAEGTRVTLLPPAPDGLGAYALAAGEESTTVWQVAGGGFGPAPVAHVPGRCSGGVWLDREGRLLALDREQGGVTKAVVVDLGRGGEVSALLQIAEGSDDRLLLADVDSGLLLVRSDAPGEDRLGWGVLGSSRPVRFPECLRTVGATAVPFAVQPGQMLMPESCAVALRLAEPGGGAGAGDLSRAGSASGAGPASGSGPDGSGLGAPGPGGSGLGGAGFGGAGDAIALWRPADRHVFRLGAPYGWLGGAGLWTADARLRLPYATPDIPCGVVELTLPEVPAAPVRLTAAVPSPARAASRPAPRPVPLQQAPLA